MASGDRPHAILQAYMAEHGLKSSRQRDVIVEVFLDSGHIAVDELLAKVRRVDARISQATVYRAVKLLVDCGLAVARHFGDGQTRYELSETGRRHHDHLICTECGAIVEFVDESIERLQDEAARQHGYRITRHRLELYGVCPSCQSHR
jgi:Fur family ferric uptake transcriptional regulator